MKETPLKDRWILKAPEQAGLNPCSLLLKEMETEYKLFYFQVTNINPVMEVVMIKSL